MMYWAIFSDAELTTFIAWQASPAMLSGRGGYHSRPWHIRALQNLYGPPVQTPRRMQKNPQMRSAKR
ncbi:hypothetical protein A9K71_10095 [Mesorhizobium sp. WSM3873]|nr:hypothetical protein A9K71_10095 [Mesorhizobium sp. WSM3873]